MLLGRDALAPRAELEYARALLVAWRAPDDQQARERDRIVAWIDRFPHDAHQRTRQAGHLTASALVIDASRRRALLTHHKKLDRWLQLGGHCDGDAALPHAAWREATEESGIDGLRVDPEPIDVDIHVIPARPGEPEHLHLDTRFAVFAPAHAAEAPSEESHALRWVALDDFAQFDTDESVKRLFRRVTSAPRPLWELAFRSGRR